MTLEFKNYPFTAQDIQDLMPIGQELSVADIRHGLDRKLGRPVKQRDVTAAMVAIKQMGCLVVRKKGTGGEMFATYTRAKDFVEPERAFSFPTYQVEPSQLRAEMGYKFAPITLAGDCV